MLLRPRHPITQMPWRLDRLQFQRELWKQAVRQRIVGNTISIRRFTRDGGLSPTLGSGSTGNALGPCNGRLTTWSARSSMVLMYGRRPGHGCTCSKICYFRHATRTCDDTVASFLGHLAHSLPHQRRLVRMYDQNAHHLLSFSRLSSVPLGVSSLPTHPALLLSYYPFFLRALISALTHRTHVS